MKRVVRACLAALPAVVFSGLASASTLIESCSVSGPTELSTTFACAQFSLGGQTVSDISIAVSGGISGSITLTNNGAVTQTGSGTTTSTFSFGSLTGFTFVNPVFSAFFTTGPLTLGPGATMVVGGLSATGNSTLGDNTTDFTDYIGAGAFSIPVTTSTGLGISGGGGNFVGSQSTNADATAVVTFTYAPTVEAPEPATITLFGLGLLGFGFLIRRFNVQR